MLEVMFTKMTETNLVVGHVSLNLSKVLLKFLQLPNSLLTCKVTGKRVNKGEDYGLEIPVAYTWTGLEKAVAWIQGKVSEKQKPLKIEK